jgi:hypothetical protein
MNCKISIEFQDIKELTEFCEEYNKRNFQNMTDYDEIIDLLENTFILEKVEVETPIEKRGSKTKELHQKARQMYQHANPNNLSYHSCFKLISDKNKEH